MAWTQSQLNDNARLVNAAVKAKAGKRIHISNLPKVCRVAFARAAHPAVSMAPAAFAQIYPSLLDLIDES